MHQYKSIILKNSYNNAQSAFSATIISHILKYYSKLHVFVWFDCSLSYKNIFYMI